MHKILLNSGNTGVHPDSVHLDTTFRRRHLVYVVRYEHGTMHESRQGSQRADATFGTILRGLMQDRHWKLARFVPRCAWFVCELPTHIARLDRTGIPCLTLHTQQERGEIPRGWPNGSPDMPR